ncbi:MAG: RNA polymerase sigma factor [Clostridiales bacterium]|jgi:RNA polymerase sigma factor (sigma-70 family)|nr:RNA polymerase sigma factor [Clostridiales bacterium]
MLDSLLKSLRQGNNEALTEIYLATKDYVYTICYSYVKDRAAAQDLMQDTYINVMRYILHYTPGTNAKAWIAQIAKNLSINYYNRSKREKSVDISSAYNVHDGREVMARDESGVIELAARALKPLELQIVLMHATAGMKHDEIAKLLNLNSSTVRWKYRQAIKKLQESIKREGLLDE